MAGGKAGARAIKRTERIDPGDFPMDPELECGYRKSYPRIAICKHVNSLRELAV